MCICCLTHEGPATGAGWETLGLGQGFGAVLVGPLLQCIPVDVAALSPSPWYSLWLGSLADRTLMYLRIVFIWQRDVSNILLMFSFSFSLAVISRLISSNLSPTTRIISPNTVSTATFTAFSITAPTWPRIREMVKFTSMLMGQKTHVLSKSFKWPMFEYICAKRKLRFSDKCSGTVRHWPCNDNSETEQESHPVQRER